MEFSEILTISIHNSEHSHEEIARAASIKSNTLSEYRCGRLQMSIDAFIQLINGFTLLGESDKALDLLKFIVGGNWHVLYIKNTANNLPGEIILDMIISFGKLVCEYKEKAEYDQIGDHDRFELRSAAMGMISLLNDFVYHINANEKL